LQSAQASTSRVGGINLLCSPIEHTNIDIFGEFEGRQEAVRCRIFEESRWRDWMFIP
jgi:hypothetical protein